MVQFTQLTDNAKFSPWLFVVSTCIYTINSPINMVVCLNYVSIHNIHAIVVLSGHQCQKNGCGSVLVVDGNMKNARTVCSVKNVGQLIFEGIGNVTVGKWS